MEVVDLTHVLSPRTPLFPAYDPVRVADKFAVDTDGFYVRSWAFDEHSGTHVDAPAHFATGAATVDAIPATELVLPLAVLDVRERLGGDPDGVAVADDVLDWERRHGPLPDRCAVAVLTGWGERAGDPTAYLNADDAGVLHSPGLSAQLTEFLKADRPGVRAIGLDTASLDPGVSTDFAAHVSWLPSGRYGIENLARLEAVPPAGATLVVGVTPFEAGSGGPARILALT